MNGNDPAPFPVAPGVAATPAAINRFHFRADQDAQRVVRVAVVGYGHWGPNIVRNLHGIEACEVAAVCDRSPAALRRVSRVYPQVSLTTDFSEILTSPDIDAVAVVTPAWTHFELAKAALLNGKHVFIEKPVTSTSAQAEELIELAERKNLKIMVDHTFLFCGAVRKIRELVDAGTLGSLYYFDSTRVNLGLFQHDISVIWDLAPHDFSIMDHVIRERPEAVVATGARHVNGVADLAFSGQGQDDADRRKGKDARLERSRAGRKNQGLRQGRPHHERP